MLSGDDIRAYLCRVPARSNLVRKGGSSCRMGRIICKIGQFHRVRFKVIKLGRVQLAGDVFEAPAPDHKHRMRGGHFGAVFSDGLALFCVAARCRWPERAPVERHTDGRFLRALGGDVEEGRQQVNQRARRADGCVLNARSRHNKRDARRVLEPVHLVPQAALAEHIAMI